MCYKLSALRLLIFVLLPVPLLGQFTYRISQDIAVEKDSNALINPWAGGFNSPQVNKMDLNGDSAEDIVIFDKTTATLRTFLWLDGEYRHAPEYETLFPSGLSTFVSLRDFDCDGKKDLFTFGQIGIFVYKQIAVSGKPFGWSKMLFPNLFTGGTSEVLLTKGFTTQINLLPGTNDLPDFTDMDGDGDLDVLNMRFVTPSSAEYHKNFSMENYGVCNLDSLARMTSTWGGFEECQCGLIAFGPQTCADLGGRSLHTGGKSTLSLDTDGDGDRDLLFTEESCLVLYHMENSGTTELPVMGNLSQLAGLIMPHYPSAYREDVDNDGTKDLLVGPNTSTRTHTFTDFANSLWYYRNTGTDALPAFVALQPNFLQDEMIDLGDQTTPWLEDLDHDGDLDLLVGVYLNPGESRASITLYENTGNHSQPSFRWLTNDFGLVLYTYFYNIRPQMADVNADGTLDLAFTASAGGLTRFFIILAPPGGQPEFNGENLTPLEIPLSLNDNARLHDIDHDGRLDILVGKSDGSLFYYHATGDYPTPNFELLSNAYLGLGASTSRQYLSTDIGDLDGDGKEDLVAGDQAGTIMIIPDFRSPNPEAIDSVVFDTYSGIYLHRNLGGSARPAIANLLGVNRPSIVVGNRQGGLRLLHNDNSVPMSNPPNVSLSPNPVASGSNLTVLSDRSVTIEIYNTMGSRVGQAQVIPGGQSTQFPLDGIAAGLYVARFTASTGTTALRFVVY